MDRSDYLEHLSTEGRRLVESAETAGPATTVPTCPDWTVADLLLHIGGAYRAAGAVLGGGRFEAPSPGPDVDPEQWYRSGLDEISTDLATAPADLTAWTFWPDAERDAATFWARRQAHETAIHRADADAAAGRPSEYDPALAADGIDELLVGLLSLRSRGIRTDQPITLAFVATDGESWRTVLSAEAVRSERASDGAEADAVISGTASELYRWLWNRGGQVEISGDPEAAAAWRSVRVRTG